MNLTLNNLNTLIPNEIQFSFQQFDNGHISYTPHTSHGFHVLVIPHSSHYIIMINKWFALTCNKQEIHYYLQWVLSPACRIAVSTQGESGIQNLQYLMNEKWYDKERIKTLDFTTIQHQQHYLLSNNLLTVCHTTLQKIFPAIPG